jgi:hypothetical protein
MRRRAYPSVLITVLAALLLLLLAHPVLAWTVTHRDPDDFEVAPDIHKATKRVFVVAADRWRFQIRIAGELGPDYRLRVLLDSRGGPAADFVMVATVRDLDLVTCDVHALEGPRIEANCGADPFRAWWGVARNDLDRDKVIRWRVAAFGGPGLREMTDRAPDTGWYR